MAYGSVALRLTASATIASASSDRIDLSGSSSFGFALSFEIFSPLTCFSNSCGIWSFYKVWPPVSRSDALSRSRTLPPSDSDIRTTGISLGANFKFLCNGFLTVGLSCSLYRPMLSGFFAMPSRGLCLHSWDLRRDSFVSRSWQVEALSMNSPLIDLREALRRLEDVGCTSTCTPDFPAFRFMRVPLYCRGLILFDKELALRP